MVKSTVPGRYQECRVSKPDKRKFTSVKTVKYLRSRAVGRREQNENEK